MSRRVVQIDLEADAVAVGGVQCFTKQSVVSALRAVATRLEREDARAISVEQFNVVADTFEAFPDAPGGWRVAGPLRRWWRREP